MKRSEINDVIHAAEEMFAAFRIALPPFCALAPAALEAPDWRAVLEARLGWDVTDYAQGRFDTLGLTLVTLRNGRRADLQAGRGMVYAEKLLISRRDQLSPMHRHFEKTEDIINRGGATLALELWHDDDGLSDREVVVPCDGRDVRLPPGGILRLAPGESVTLHPHIWHAFWGEGGDVLIGEVSTVNDDESDNLFREPLPRFSEIEEDAAPHRWLVSDYARLLG